MEEKIDFVITWVDNNDEKWLQERDSYCKYAGTDSRIQRYRDWDLLKYWFRGVEKYAPWVNKVHFVTYGHVPKWLNTSYSKLNIVLHEEFIPAEFLPTFNSNTIDLNLHRIKGLSNKFVYFNDDVFIIDKVTKDDFFKSGLPCDMAVLGCVMPLEDAIYNIIFNNLRVINKYFLKKDFIKNSWNKIFNYKYRSYLIRTILLLPFSKHTGFYDFHLDMAFDKNTFNQVWLKEYELLNSTCKHKFRSHDDVNVWLMRYWQLASGQFHPRRIMGEYFEIGDNRINDFIIHKTNSIICCNDVRDNIEFNVLKQNLQSLFSLELGNKSSYEI